MQYGPLLSLLFLSFLSLTLTAQREISGSVTDPDGTPLPSANIVLFSLPDSLFTKGEICDEEGAFTLRIPDEFSGYLEADFLGFKKTKVPLTDGRRQYDLRLTPVPETLAGVTVTAQKQVFEKKADRLVINPGSNITSMGGNVLELLEKSPGLVVNRVNQSLSLNGQEGVLVMIDHKIRRLPSDALLQILQGLSLNDVERIELITNPPAEYEATGGGIVHIVTKGKEIRGISGNLGGSLNYLHRLGGGLNASVQWHAGRLQGFATYSYQDEQRAVTWAEELFVPLGMTSTEARSHIDRIEKIPVHNLTMGLTWQFAEQTTGEILLSGNHRGFSQSGINEGSYRIGASPLRNFSTELFEENIRKLATLYGGLQHRLGDGHQLSTSLEYIYSHQDQPSYYLNKLDSGEEFGVEAGKINPLGTWVGKIDYRWQIDPGKSLGIGSKYNTSYFDNQVDIYNLTAADRARDDLLSNHSLLDEDIFSAYISATWRINEKWSWRAGVRLEQTRTELTQEPQITVVDRNYTNWFLNLSTEYEIGERSRLAFSYNDRITRPTFNDLAPFVFYSNPVTVFYGNPSLLPALSHTASLEWSRGPSWITLQYTWIDDQIVPFQPNYDEDAQLMFRTAENLQKAQMLRLQGNFLLQPFSWLEYNNTLSFIYNRLQANEPEAAFTNPEFSYQGTLNVSLPGGFSLGASGNFFYRQTWGRAYMEPYGHLDIGINKEFRGSQSRISLTFVDVFDTYQWDMSLIPDAAPQIDMRTAYKFGIQGIRLSAMVPFGNSQVKKREISTGSDMEKSRLN